MKPLKTLMLVLFVSLLSLQANAQRDKVVEPELIAVKFHADWCGSCKAMGPNFTDLQNKLDGSAILFVELDFTNRTTGHQAMMLASALGIGEVVKENTSTGFILLLDRKTKEIEDRFLKDKTVKEMASRINELL